MEWDLYHNTIMATIAGGDLPRQGSESTGSKSGEEFAKEVGETSV
jgi:hypothetical protein